MTLAAASANPARVAVPTREDPVLGFAQGTRLLLQTVQGLPVVGWEVSCRISPSGVTTDRLLVGLETQGVSGARLHGLASALGMPNRIAAEFQEGLGLSHQVMLAVEASANGLELRAYLVFKDTGHGMRGFKWFAHDAGRSRVTDYVPLAKTWQAVCDFYGTKSSGLSQSSVGIANAAHEAARLIAWAAMKSQTPGTRVDFFSVSEAEGARDSTCFRLYESGLTFAHVKNVVANLLSVYQLQAQWPRVQALMSSRPLGWIAVGEDSLGIPFLTLYGEASVLDARRLMVFGAGR